MPKNESNMNKKKSYDKETKSHERGEKVAKRKQKVMKWSLWDVSTNKSSGTETKVMKHQKMKRTSVEVNMNKK